MSDPSASRFAPQNKTTQQRLSTNTVGLVALSDFRKRRAEVLEQQGREARDAGGTGTSTPELSTPGTPDEGGSDSASGSIARPTKKPKKKKNQAKKLLSFEDDDDEDDAGERDDSKSAAAGSDTSKDVVGMKNKIKANASIGLAPKVVTKSALRKEAAERETLRREFVAIQEAVKATEFAIPFVFYDGANIPGGTVRMKKGDFVWVFLDKSRKVGAELGVGEQANSTRAWARVGVDDLMLVRGTVIIPHHYEFYYFVLNKSTGPGGKRLFDYSSSVPPKARADNSDEDGGSGQVSSPSAKVSLPDISTLEGASDDPAETKVVDRRWYERNKHIYPASTWQEFDPEMDYSSQIRKDTGGNTFFYTR